MRAHPNLFFALSLSLAACATPVIDISVNVVTTACPQALSADPQRDPGANVDTLRFTLSGDGLSPVTVTAPFTSTSASGIPNVPLGTNRRIVAEGLVNGLVRSRGDSGPFNVTSAGNVSLTIFLRVVDAFVYTGSSDGTVCTHLNTPRAGHQMTLLPDGRVLITGGYNIDGSGSLHYQTQAEIYDPQSGSFANVGMQEQVPRAYHLAVPVTVNSIPQVLLFGGETSDNGSLGPAGPFELYTDSGFNTLGLPTGAPARERAAMALDQKTGFAVMAGGANGPDVPNTSVTIYGDVTYFNPQQDSIVEADQPLAQPLADAVAVGRKNVSMGTTLGGLTLLGGLDVNGNASAQISGVIFSDSEHQYISDRTYEIPALTSLPHPRVHHSAVVAADDSVLVLGGETQANSTYELTTDAVTYLDPSQAAVGDATERLSQSRADGCAVLLGNGSVLYAGGAWGDGNGVHSVQSVDVLTPADAATTVRALEGPTAGGSWYLQAARHQAACVVLADGSVLVTGGLQFQSTDGEPIALGSAEIYTPPSSSP